MYQLDIDVAKRRIRMKIVGFPDMDEFERFEIEIQAAVRKLNAGGPSFDMLVDRRESPVFTPEIAEQTRQMIAWLVDQGLRKNAIIITSKLAEMQLSRIAPGLQLSFFQTEEEAMRWLDE